MYNKIGNVHGFKVDIRLVYGSPTYEYDLLAGEFVKNICDNDKILKVLENY